MKKYKMTASLMEAIKWADAVKDNAKWCEAAKKGVEDNISGVFKPSPEMKKGSDFEETVNEELMRNGFHREKIREPFRWLAGYIQQPWISPVEITLNTPGDIVLEELIDDAEKDISFVFRGKMDYLSQDKKSIVDLKTTSKTIDPSKYLSRAQHKVYALSNDASQVFTYLVVELDEFNNIQHTKTIEIDITDKAAIRQSLKEDVISALQYLKNNDFLGLYRKHKMDVAAHV